MTVSKIKLMSFRNKLRQCVEEEKSLRQKMKVLYDQLVLDAGDDKMARRYVQQEYFRIQKDLLTQVIKDRLEFHPFFGAANLMDLDEIEEDDDDDDSIL